MASYGKVLDLLDDRYLELQDVTGNVEPLPTLVPYEEYTQNVLVYRMDTNHEIFMGLIQDFTLRRAHETRKELWTWLVQWEVDETAPAQQPASPKKARLDAWQANPLSKAPTAPRKSPALTIFERRTLDGALMLEEDMLRILIDIVQVSSSLVPNFIEFLYRWVDYYEGDGKALKAALRWEIPSLWDFEYHPLVLPRDEKDAYKAHGSDAQHGREREERASSVSAIKAEELRQSSPTKKMHARLKPDLAAIELQTFYTEESERLQYREVKFGIQPPKLRQPLPPLINIPRDVQKRTKYYAACFKSRQRAMFLLVEAGVTMRQINNYQKLQTAHPRETSETGDGNGLRNYQKDAKYAQTQYELKERQTKQREISISNKLAVEAQLAATHAIPDGAAGLPLIPPTPLYAKKPDMAGEMMRKIKAAREKKGDGKISIVPKPLVGLMKSKIFEGAHSRPGFPSPDFGVGTRGDARPEKDDEGDGQDTELWNTSSSSDEDGSDESYDSDDNDDGAPDAVSVPVSNLPRPTLPMPQPAQCVAPAVNNAASPSILSTSNIQPAQDIGESTPSHIAAYMRNLNTEQAQRLLPLLSPQVRHAASSTLQGSLHAPGTVPPAPLSFSLGPAGTLTQNPSGCLMNPSNAWHSLHNPTPLLPHPASHSQQSLGQTVPVWTTSPIPSPVAGPLTLPRQRTANLSQAPILYPPALPSVPVPSPGALHQHTPSRAPHSIPAYTLSLTAAGNSRSPAAVSPGFDPEVFMRLRRQQEMARSVASADATIQPGLPVIPGAEALRPSSAADQRTPAERQRVLSDVFNNRTAAAQAAPPAHNQSEWNSVGRDLFSSHSPAPHSAPPSLPRLSIQPSSPWQLSASQALQNPSSLAPSPTPQPPAATLLLSPPRPLITRHPPPPLPLPTPSPLSTLSPQILTTSPFLAAQNTPKPIQIYLPKIVISGTGTGPDSTATDALLLGHEDTATGHLVLTKAILLRVGVWANTLRKVRTGRWSVLETYAVPAWHPARDKKGKAKARDGGYGAHGAVYGKLVQACGFMAGVEREVGVTKRWRVSRGVAMEWGRGAVWEGWGVGLERGIGMSAEERVGALRGGGEGMGIDEAERRRNEMDELMDDEDEDMDE